MGPTHRYNRAAISALLAAMLGAILDRRVFAATEPFGQVWWLAFILGGIGIAALLAPAILLLRDQARERR